MKKLFNEVWTKETVEGILDEYLASEDVRPFICIRSKAFQEIYQVPEYREEIVKLAREFDYPGVHMNDYGTDETFVLFHDDIDSPANTMYLVRVNFLNSEIKRLENQ